MEIEVSICCLYYKLQLQIFNSTLSSHKLYSQQYTVKITHTITPGSDETGVIVCCYSPPEYPILAKCPCFDYPEYIVNEMKASQ